MNVEQVIRCALPVRDLSFVGQPLTRTLADLQGVIQFAGFVAQTQAEIGFLDAMGRVQLKNIAVLVNVIKGGTKTPGHADHGMSESPGRGTLIPFPVLVSVFECNLRHFLQCQPGFKRDFSAVKRQRIVRKWIPIPRRRIKAPITVVPGAKLIVRESHVSELFPRNLQLQFVVVIVEKRASVRGQRRVGRDRGRVMEILDAAEDFAAAVSLLELAPAALNEKSAGRKLDPVVKGILASLEHLPLGQWRGSGCRWGVGFFRRKSGHRRTNTQQGRATPPNPSVWEWAS